MSKLRKLACATALAGNLALPSLSAAGTLYIIGLPRQGNGRDILASVSQRALTLGPGDGLQVYDAKNRQRISSVEIPDELKMQRFDRRAEIIMPAMAAVKAYTDAMPPQSSDVPNFVHAVSFFDEIAPIVAQVTGRFVRVLLQGSIVFSTPGILERKEYWGNFPSDGLILNDRSHSPFGTRGLRDLNGVTVDYCFTDAPSLFITPEHRERMERAWALATAARGSTLTTFTADLKNCWERFGAPQPPVGRGFTVDADDALKNFMYRPQDITVTVTTAPPIKTARSGQPEAAPAVAQAESQKFRQRVSKDPPKRRDGPAWLGIQWKDPTRNDPVDLDLYVRCSPRTPFLFYGNKHTAEGRHNIDFTSGTGKEAFETVDLTSSCPDITSAEVFVNFYGGAVRERIKGLFGIEFDGGFYTTEFEMPALFGNGGADRANRLNSPHWVKIDLAKVLNLPPTATQAPAIPAFNGKAPPRS